MENILAPSILSADFKILGEQIRQTEEARSAYIHFDVMDGIFVPEHFIRDAGAFFDQGTDRAGDGRTSYGDGTDPLCKGICKMRGGYHHIHLEACEDPAATLEAIHDCGVKAGISIKPGTPVES